MERQRESNFDAETSGSEQRRAERVIADSVLFQPAKTYATYMQRTQVKQISLRG
jgi:hypothetical protein